MTASSREWPRSILTAAALVILVAVVGILYWAQLVLIPLAAAGFLTFLLTPVVERIQRSGLPRVPAVIAVVALVGLLLGGLGWLVASQVDSLMAELPQYR
ncbi:MAG: AI-2E family transporter, partial [Planctomycetes bacterium]|nr:AI-2E family transporter [Planctomycetota bacterium]